VSQQPRIRFVCGMRGHGKTTLARELADPAPRLLAFDPFQEQDCLQLELEAFRDYLDQAAVAGRLDRFRLGLVGAAEQGEDLCALAWVMGQKLEGKPLVVLLDEADMVAQPGQEPDVFRRVVSQGRHAGIEVIACTRRPAEVSRLITSSAHELYIFRTQEPRDLAYFRGLLAADLVDTIAELKPFEYVAWTPTEWRRGVETPPGGTASGAGAGTSE